jgi:NADP-dependent 3-hydroxy acid dehydrogenase YdfG
MTISTLGAGSGMGNRLVHQILARKDKVIATTRNIKDLEEFASNLDAYAMELDVTDSTENIQKKIAEAVEMWGRIDVLVGNAGAAHKILM